MKGVIDPGGFVLEPNSDITKVWRLSRFCKASNSVYREVPHIRICSGIMKSDLNWFNLINAIFNW